MYTDVLLLVQEDHKWKRELKYNRFWDPKEGGSEASSRRRRAPDPKKKERHLPGSPRRAGRGTPAGHDDDEEEDHGGDAAPDGQRQEEEFGERGCGLRRERKRNTRNEKQPTLLGGAGCSYRIR
ncbi:hypothetical protein EYF80_042510 [Liparis tanakae]|uniref:Uncharacterized protein n=1 Tax=Liparis tanakae TaxID=230148 RepID=A0A4Z2G409_9TELE|nr:hypothetical protein EYF80_042510 [Liparis tanakae]